MNLEYVSRLIRVITHSQNLDSFCRNALHNLWSGQRFSSVHYFTLAQDGTLHKAAGYSTLTDTSLGENIAISSNHPAARTVKSGKACLDDKKSKTLSVPIVRDGWLFGVLILEPLDPTSDSVDETELMALGHALAVYHRWSNERQVQGSIRAGGTNARRAYAEAVANSQRNG